MSSSYAAPTRLPPRPHVANPHRPGQPKPDLVRIGLDLVGRLVLDARRRAGLSQMQLERMSGIDQTTISRLERGRLAGIRFHRLAALLGCLVLEGDGQ